MHENMDEPIVPIVQPDLIVERSEEGNYSHIVSQVEPPVARRNVPERGIDRDRCMYNNFLGAKPPSLSRSPNPIEIMDWISKMEMVFGSYNCSDKQKIVFASDN